MKYRALKAFAYITSPIGNITRETNVGQVVDFKTCPAHIIDYYIAEGYIELVDEQLSDESDASVESEPSPEDDAENVIIPDTWRDLSWPELRSLASRLTTNPVTNKTDAVSAIEAELARRSV